MYKYQRKITDEEIDAAGIMFYTQVYNIIHEAYEAFLSHNEFSINKILATKSYILPIVHSEADYKKPVLLADSLTVELIPSIEGDHSYSINYKLTNQSSQLVATANTIHVCIDKKTHQKIVIPDELNKVLC